MIDQKLLTVPYIIHAVSEDETSVCWLWSFNFEIFEPMVKFTKILNQNQWETPLLLPSKIFFKCSIVGTFILFDCVWPETDTKTWTQVVKNLKIHSRSLPIVCIYYITLWTHDDELQHATF